MVVVKEMQAVVEQVSTSVYGDADTIKFIPGQEVQAVLMLRDIVLQVGDVFIALVQPFDEVENNGLINVTFPRIVIGTKTDSTLPVLDRYNETFIPILYRIYEALFQEITHPTTPGRRIRNARIGKGEMIKRDVPGSLPAAEDSTDYLDTIELYNLKLSFTNNCTE